MTTTSVTISPHLPLLHDCTMCGMQKGHPHDQKCWSWVCTERVEQVRLEALALEQRKVAALESIAKQLAANGNGR